jgi:hypothetical protein
VSQKICYKLPLTADELRHFLLSETVMRKGKITQNQFLKYFFPSSVQASGGKNASDSSDDEQMKRTGSISNVKESVTLSFDGSSFAGLKSAGQR